MQEPFVLAGLGILAVAGAIDPEALPGHVLHLEIVADRDQFGVALPPFAEHAFRAVCARAMAPDPADRYPDVRALAQDVARYRAGQPVSAYRESLVERAGRFGRTYRTAILLVLAYIIMRAIVAFTTGR